MSYHIPECDYTLDVSWPGPAIELTPCTCPADLDSYWRGYTKALDDLVAVVAKYDKPLAARLTALRAEL